MRRTAAGTLFTLLLTAAGAASAYAAAGDLDTTFGVNGVATGGSGIGVNEIAVQPTDGRIVAVGETADGKFAIERFTRNGSLDSTFGTDGVTVTGFSMHATPEAIAFQPDGKIVVAGCNSDGDFCGYDPQTRTQFAVARYDAAGRLDSSFGSGGTVSWAPSVCNNALAYGVGVQGDGKIVVGGTCDGSFVTARFDPDGSVDTSYNQVLGPVGLGYSIANFNNVALGFAMALQSDGRIVVTGDLNNSVGLGDAAAARWLPSGALDDTFGSGGEAVLPFGSDYRAVQSMTIDGSGRVVVTGESAYVSKRNNWDVPEFVVGRWTSAGQADPTFGKGGVVKTRFSTRKIERLAEGHDVVVQPDGKIVVCGYAGWGHSPNYQEHFALARYLPSGALDSSFGNNGRLISIGGDCNSDAVTAGGKLLAAGGLWVARYQAG